MADTNDELELSLTPDGEPAAVIEDGPHAGPELRPGDEGFTLPEIHTRVLVRNDDVVVTEVTITATCHTAELELELNPGVKDLPDGVHTHTCLVHPSRGEIVGTGPEYRFEGGAWNPGHMGKGDNATINQLILIHHGRGAQYVGDETAPAA